MQGAEQQGDRGILGRGGATLASRSVITTANRWSYPFAPVVRRGLSVPLTAVPPGIAINRAPMMSFFIASAGIGRGPCAAGPGHGNRVRHIGCFDLRCPWNSTQGNTGPDA